MKKVAPKNYKMLLKTAMKDIVGKTYEEFFEEVNYVIEIINAKIKSGWATPDDLEYYYLSEELLEGISRDGSSSSTQSRSMNENMEALKHEFVKSNFMKNFIFNNNFQHIYESYFDAKIQKMSKRSKWELKMKKGEYWEHLCIFRSLKKR